MLHLIFYLCWIQRRSCSGFFILSLTKQFPLLLTHFFFFWFSAKNDIVDRTKAFLLSFFSVVVCSVAINSCGTNYQTNDFTSHYALSCETIAVLKTLKQRCNDGDKQENAIAWDGTMCTMMSGLAACVCVCALIAPSQRQTTLKWNCRHTEWESIWVLPRKKNFSHNCKLKWCCSRRHQTK